MSRVAYTLPSLHALIEPSHILFGSDYPFMPESSVAENVAGLVEYRGFDPQVRQLIEREYALELFPRLAAIGGVLRKIR